VDESKGVTSVNELRKSLGPTALGTLFPSRRRGKSGGGGNCTRVFGSSPWALYMRSPASSFSPWPACRAGASRTSSCVLLVPPTSCQWAGPACSPAPPRPAGWPGERRYL